MATKLDIVTDAGSLDLFHRDDESFYVTRQIFDFNDLEHRKGDFTRSIKIPATAENLTILGIGGADNSVADPEQTIPCSIVMNGVTVALSARLLHVGTTLVKGVDTLEVAILYGNFNLFDNIVGGSVRDISWADLAIDWTVDGLKALTLNSETHVWATADWFGDPNANPATLGSWDIKRGGFFVFSKEICRRIILDAGFTMVLDEDIPVNFLHHAIACPVDQFIITEELPSAIISVGQKDTNQVVIGAAERATFEVALSGTLWNTTTNEFVISEAKDYGISIKGIASYIEAKASTAPCELRVQQNGLTIATELFPDTAADVEFFIGIEVALADGDIISAEMYAPVDGNKDSELTIHDLAVFELAPEGAAPSNVVQIENFLPDIDRRDFLSGILANFNLMVETNDLTKEVTLTPFDAVRNIPEQDWTLNVQSNLPLDITPALTGYARKNYANYLADDLTRRIDADTVFNVENEILNSEKTIMQLPYAASDDSNRYPDRIKQIKVPFITQVFEGGVGTGEGLKIESNGNFTFTSEAEPVDFFIGNYLMPNTTSRAVFYIDQKTSSLTGHIMGTGWSTTNLNYGVLSLSINNPAPRVAMIYQHFDGSLGLDPNRYILDGYDRQGVGADLLPVDHSSASFIDDMRMENVLGLYYSGLIAAVRSPEFLQAWFTFSAAQFVEIDLLRPVYIQSLNSLYFINKVNQFKLLGDVRIDLVRYTLVEDQVKFSATLLPQVLSALITFSVYTLDIDGSPATEDIPIDFEASSTLEFNTNADNSSSYVLRFINMLSGTTIKSLSAVAATTLYTLTIIPSNEALWEGGDIYAIVTPT